MLLTPSSFRPGVHRRLLSTISLNAAAAIQFKHVYISCRVYTTSLSQRCHKRRSVSHRSLTTLFGTCLWRC